MAEPHGPTQGRAHGPTHGRAHGPTHDPTHDRAHGAYGRFVTADKAFAHHRRHAEAVPCRPECPGHSTTCDRTALLLYAADVDPADDILAQKRALRARMTEWRKALDPEARAAAGTALARIGLGFLAPSPGATVSAFAPLPDELRLWPLLRRLARERYQLALPVMQGKGRALIFRAWRPGDAMERRVWGIAEPKADQPELAPDILLVPLLAFDTHGWRLGYGGGYYDRTLRGLRARKAIIAVGVGYQQQAVDAVPHLGYDERLDWVLTPAGPHKRADG